VHSLVVLQESPRRGGSYLLGQAGGVTFDGVPGLNPCIYSAEKGPYPLEACTSQMFCGHGSRSLIGTGAIHDRFLIAGI
jgi:hypothetical protein